jgi:hypothetical protein
VTVAVARFRAADALKLSLGSVALGAALIIYFLLGWREDVRLDSEQSHGKTALQERVRGSLTTSSGYAENGSAQ